MADSKGRVGEGLGSLDAVARLVDGRVLGDPARSVRGVAPLDRAGPEALSFLSDRRYAEALRDTRAGAVLVSSDLASELPPGLDAVVVEDAQLALVTLLSHLHPEPTSAPGVHPTAVLGEGLRLGRGVRIGAYAVVEQDCRLGDGVRVGPHVVVGRGCRIGEGSVLHPHAVLYPGTVLGARVIVHAGARLGSDGFGYAFSGGHYRKVPQVGRCIVEDDVEVGANSCVDRGAMGDTVVGRGSKLDNLVHVAHNVQVGSHCAMAAQVGLAGSTRVGSGVVFGGQAGASGHLEIGDGARISARAGVIGDVAAGETVAGFPAREHRSFLRGTALMLRLPELFRRLRAVERKLAGGPSQAVGKAD